MTGFLASVFGFSLTKDSIAARWTISGSNSGRERLRFLGISAVVSETGGGEARVPILIPKKEMLDNRAEGKGGEKGQCAHDENGADQQTDKERTVGGKGS